MFKTKQKIKLSENLQMGVSGPSSQGTILKTGGIIFIVLSVFLTINIFKNLKSVSAAPRIATSQELSQQVLGAYDQNTQTKTISYTVQKGDTLFNVAASQNIDWSIIATLNNLKAPYSLKPGTILKLPVQN